MAPPRTLCTGPLSAGAPGKSGVWLLDPGACRSAGARAPLAAAAHSLHCRLPHARGLVSWPPGGSTDTPQPSHVCLLFHPTRGFLVSVSDRACSSAALGAMG